MGGVVDHAGALAEQVAAVEADARHGQTSSSKMAANSPASARRLKRATACALGTGAAPNWTRAKACSRLHAMADASPEGASQPPAVWARTSAVEDSAGATASTGWPTARYSKSLPGTAASAPSVVL